LGATYEELKTALKSEMAAKCDRKDIEAGAGDANVAPLRLFGQRYLLSSTIS
jgi:hypothetical protein